MKNNIINTDAKVVAKLLSMYLSNIFTLKLIYVIDGVRFIF